MAEARAGGAMNSGPTGSLTQAFTMWQAARRASASSFQPSIHARLVEHPPDRQLEHVLAVVAGCKHVQLVYGLQVLRKARWLKFRIHLPQVVAGELRVRFHASAQKTAAQSAVNQRAHAVFARVRENIAVALFLEKVVGILRGIELRHSAEAVHLLGRKVAHADGADLASLLEVEHR